MEKFFNKDKNIFYDENKEELPQEKKIEELKKVDGGSAVTVEVNSNVETHSENNSKTLNANDIGGNVSF